MPEKQPAKILIVDDSEFKRRSLQRKMSALGHETIIAENGLEGIVQARHNDPDLILLDIVMPVMNGIECLEQLKADPILAKIPVIVISHKDSHEDVADCVAQGAVDYIKQDTPEAVLNARVESSLKVRMQQRQEDRLRNQIEKYLIRARAAENLADELLHAIFPREKVEELKQTSDIKPTRHERVTVLFCDVVGFTAYCDAHEPDDVIPPLQTLIEAFEQVSDRHGVEKIKTIGDCFMAAVGLFNPGPDDALKAVKCGLAMTLAADEIEVPWKVRVGIHAGPLMAGKIGKSKYCYDLWGDTVNTAARVESSGLPGKVVVSRVVWEQIASMCRGVSLGLKDAKGKELLELFRVDELAE